MSSVRKQPSPPPPRETKRRKVGGKKTKTNGAASSNEPNNFVKYLAEAVSSNNEDEDSTALGLLQAHLVPLLTCNDQTSLRMVCRSFRAGILKGNNRLVREERLSTKMRYDDWGADCRFSVYQLQRFRFLISGTPLGKIQVNFDLLNFAYLERHNEIEQPQYFGSATRPKRPGETTIQVKIYYEEDAVVDYHNNNHDDDRVLFQMDSKTHHVFCGCTDSNQDYPSPVSGQGCFWCRGYTVQGMLDDGEGDASDDNRNRIVREHLEISVPALYMCAVRIAEQGGPPIGYLMRLLPTALHSFIPEEFDWNGPRKDRKTVIEWDYQAARTVDEWWDIVLAQGDCDYELDELPWYRDDYDHSDNDEYDDSDDDGDY